MAFSDPYEQWKAMGRPGGSFSAWQGGQRPMQETAAPMATPAPVQQPAPAQGGTPFGGTLEQQAQWAHDNIDSTFDMNYWRAQGQMDSGCPPNMPYRSTRGGTNGACVEKPDNCPEGTTLHGANCISNEQANAMFGGGYGNMAGQPQGQPGAVPADPMQQLQQYMSQFQGQPQAGTGTHRPMGETAGLGLPQLMQPYQAPQASATSSLLTQGMAKPQTSAGLAGSLGTGWSGGQDGLTSMMAKQQRKPGQLGAGQWWT
jgi:hypothetical protein